MRHLSPHIFTFPLVLFQFIINTLQNDISRACGELIICKANIVRLQREEDERKRELVYRETIVSEVIAGESKHEEVKEILRCVREKMAAQGVEDVKTAEKRVNDQLEQKLGVGVKYEELGVYGRVVGEELRKSIKMLQREKEDHISTFRRQLNLLRVWTVRLMVIHTNARFSWKVFTPFPVGDKLIEYLKQHSDEDVFRNVDEWAHEESGEKCLRWNEKELQRFSERLEELRADTGRELEALLVKIEKEADRKRIEHLYRELGIRPACGEQQMEAELETHTQPPEGEEDQPRPGTSSASTSKKTARRGDEREHSLTVGGEEVEVIIEEGSDNNEGDSGVEQQQQQQLKRRRVTIESDSDDSQSAAAKKRKTTKQAKKKKTTTVKDEWIKGEDSEKRPWRRLRDPGTKKNPDEPLLKILRANPEQLPDTIVTRLPKHTKDTVLHKKNKWNKDVDIATQKCPACDEDIPGDRVDGHISTQHNPQVRPGDTSVFACCECKEMYLNPRKRNTHQKTHRPYDALFVCDSVTCLKVFHGDQDWERHLAGVHGIKDRFKCFHCDRTTDNNDKLNRHLQSLGEERCEVRFDKAYLGTTAVCLECHPVKTSPKVVAAVTFTTGVQKLEHYSKYHPGKCVGRMVEQRKVKWKANLQLQRNVTQSKLEIFIAYD